MSFLFSFGADAPLEQAGQAERFVWDGEAIPFAVCRGSARRRRTLIRITATGAVEVVLPPRAPYREALAALRSRGDWVLRQWRSAQSRPVPQPLCYAAGASHLFLGEYRRLELVEGISEKQPCSIEEKDMEPVVAGTSQFIRLAVRSGDPETVHKALFVWYKAQIRKRIVNRLSALCPCIPWLATVPPWRVRLMRRRWGSCTGRGVITLNTHLIKAPPQCLDYVLLHELAHLQEHNHSKRYYAVLERLLPEWKDVRRELAAWAPRILG